MTVSPLNPPSSSEVHGFVVVEDGEIPPGPASNSSVWTTGGNLVGAAAVVGAASFVVPAFVTVGATFGLGFIVGRNPDRFNDASARVREVAGAVTSKTIAAARDILALQDSARQQADDGCFEVIEVPLNGAENIEPHTPPL